MVVSISRSTATLVWVMSKRLICEFLTLCGLVFAKTSGAGFDVGLEVFFQHGASAVRCNSRCSSAPVPVSLGRKRMAQCTSVRPPDSLRVISPW